MKYKYNKPIKNNLEVILGYLAIIGFIFLIITIAFPEPILCKVIGG